MAGPAKTAAVVNLIKAYRREVIAASYASGLQIAAY